MKFYKRDPDAALAGMADLTLQERGAYNTILDLLYSRDGVLLDDDAIMRRVLGCHGTEWKRVKGSLVAKKKLWVEDGYLKANRVESVLKEAENFSETQRKRAVKRWEKEGKTPENSENNVEYQCTEDAKSALPLTPIATPTPKAVATAPNLSWTALVSSALGFDITAMEPNRALAFVRSGQTLIAEGLSIVEDVIPVIRERRDGGNLPADLKSLVYFRAAALERKAARAVVVEAEKAREAAPFEDTDRSGWARRLKSWLSCGYWPTPWGPRPRSGECHAPSELLAEAQTIWDAQGGHPEGAFPADPNGRWTEWKRLKDLRAGPDSDYGVGLDNVIPLPRRAAQ